MLGKYPVITLCGSTRFKEQFMADAIYVINVDGYIGESTRSEIEYALRNGKRVYYLEPLD